MGSQLPSVVSYLSDKAGWEIVSKYGAWSEIADYSDRSGEKIAFTLASVGKAMYHLLVGCSVREMSTHRLT